MHRCRSEFSIIDLSETWMNDEKGDDYSMYNMKGYTVHYVNRKNKKGGGTALFVKDTIQQHCLKQLTYSINNCFEVVTLEIKERKGCNSYVVCLYRPPNTRIDVFFTTLYAFLRENKK